MTTKHTVETCIITKTPRCFLSIASKIHSKTVDALDAHFAIKRSWEKAFRHFPDFHAQPGCKFLISDSIISTSINHAKSKKQCK